MPCAIINLEPFKKSHVVVPKEVQVLASPSPCPRQSPLRPCYPTLWACWPICLSRQPPDQLPPSAMHLPSPLPLPSPFPLHFPCLPWSMVNYIFLHSTIPLFFVPPPPGPITSNVYMRNVKVKSWFVPLQSPFLFSRKLLIRSHIHVYFCWNVVYLFNKKLISLQCLQGEKWVSGFGFEVSGFTPSIFLKHMNHSKDPKKIDCFFMRLKP